MPVYEVTTTEGTFEVETDQEANEQQLQQLLAQQSNQQPNQQPAESQPSGIGKALSDFAFTPGYAPFKDAGNVLPEDQAPGPLAATGRRVNEAVNAFFDLPQSAVGVVTGGKEGRLAAALRLLQGVGSPISIIGAPVGGLTESTLENLGLPKGWSRLGGDLSELLGTLGIGLAGKAGKLGGYGEQLAKTLGVGRADMTIAEQLRHDPQLRFVMGRQAREAAENPLEQLARTDAPMEELALSLKSPELAANFLEKRKVKSDQWSLWAKSNQIIDEVPEDVRFSPKELVEFQPPAGKDLGMLATLGTPTNTAPRVNPQAGASAFEMALGEMRLKHSINSRQARVAEKLVGHSNRELAEVIAARESGDLSKLTPGAKDVLDWLDNKFEVDRQVIIPRLREVWRSRVEKQVERELTKTATAWGEKVDPQLLKQKVDERITKVIPDDWGLDDYLPHIFPGHYKILDATGELIGTADTKLAAKMFIRDQALAGKAAENFKVTSTSFFDSDLLRFYKGRVSRTMDSIAKGAVMSDDEIRAAASGDLGGKQKFKFFGSLVERQGKATGYLKDMNDVMSLYDRGIERWMQLSDLSAKVTPLIQELGQRGYGGTAEILQHSLQRLWGYRAPISQHFDNTLQAIPVLNQLVAPMALERWTQTMKTGLVNVFLRYTPRFHAVNATQVAATLWPISTATDIVEAGKLLKSDLGKQLLKAHGITEAGTRLEGFGRSLGATEVFNQNMSFLTMYNKARKLGLDDARAADYAKLRGNLYTQFLGLTSDVPYRFSQLDPMGIITLFQRFPVKQIELLTDIIRDRNFPAAAKWMSVNLLLGGFRAAALGQAGWLTEKLYRQVKEEYGETVADVFHSGLPSLIGLDLANSVMVYNPPFGENWAEKLGNTLGGVVGSLATSVAGALGADTAPEPNAGKRVLNALTQRIPLAKQLDAVRRLWEDDYDFRDAQGRLRYKGDFYEAVKQLMGSRTLRQAQEEGRVNALMQVREWRDGPLNYAASRFGQAQLSGVALSKDMQEAVQREVDNWNSMWPEAPITGADIRTRAEARMRAATETLYQRMLRSAPRAIRRSETFADPTLLTPGGG